MSVVKQGGTDGYYYDSYDAVGKLLTGHQITDGATYPMSYGYDLMGNLTTETYPSGRVVTTSYDAAGRLSTVSGQQSGEANKTYTSGYSYTAAGAVSAMQMSNGAMSEQTLYNARLQPTQMEWRKVAGNVVILGLDYSYGATNQNNGNLSSQGIRVGTSTIATQTYSYDHLNRLSGVSESNPVASWQQAYFYDRYGNRAVSSASSYIPTPRQTPTASSVNDLASVISPTTNRIIATSDYHYDTSGNLDKQPNVAAGFDQMSYDAENRQVSYTKAGVTTSYSYDGDGRRVKKVDSSGTTIFVYNVAGLLMAEYHTDPVPPVVGGGGTSYLMADHMGSTRVVTQADGTVKARYDYLPFGEEVGAERRPGGLGYGGGDSTRQKFTSKERDGESGLDYFGARYYSSAQGRFTSVDQGSPEPLDSQTWNRYRYARNNPLYYIDEDGNKDKPAKAKSINNALATDPTLLEVIKASNNFSQSAFEDAFNRGELRGNLTSHGGNTLRGLAGEAIVIDRLRGHISILNVSSQPVAFPGIKPDVGALIFNGQVGDVNIRGQLNNILQDPMSGKTGDVFLRNGLTVGLFEVKSGFTPRNIPKGADQVVAMAAVLKAFGAQGAAVLVVDKGAWGKLSGQERTTVYNKVTAAGGYIQVISGLAVDAARRARQVVKQVN